MAEGAAEACVCILFYGAEDKHLKLAQRILNEPMRRLAARNIEFRFGCNAVGAETQALLGQQIGAYFHNSLVIDSGENIMKYPIMRRMFYDTPITAPITLWFDHDSYLFTDLDADNWFNRVSRHFNSCDMLGSVYHAQLPPEQEDWAAKQPWYKESAGKKYMSYSSGGWWAVKTALLQQYNWPPEDFKQKHGDRVFGALFHHQNLLLCHFRDGVCVNANDSGVEAAAPRTIT